MTRIRKSSEIMRILAIFILSFIYNCLGNEVILNLNTKRPIFVTSDKFLSFTLDPAVIFAEDSSLFSSNVERSINMAKALSPAYIRFGGPQNNSFIFESQQFLQNNETNSDQSNSENILKLVHQWAGKSGLSLITCIGQYLNENNENASWNSQEEWNFIAFSDQMGYNTSWQLGYECQSRSDLHGEKLGEDVKSLRRMLDAFPRYSSSIVVGPDVTAYKTKEQQQYLLDFFNSAGSALSAITWHPDFSEITLTENGVTISGENLLSDKKNLQKTIGQLLSEKPLWIAESKEEKCKSQFIGALVWTRRLGNAAKLGAQVLMRQPDNSNLFKPTPDFWVSLLHKTLVGPEVLNMKIQSRYNTHVNFFCQCTKPSSKYEKGCFTVFGINLTPNKIVANFKGIKIKELHNYILLPGFDASNRMFAETVLLNNKLLTLENGKVPEIEPIKLTNEKGVSLNLPSGGIGFWVIPDLKLKACRFQEERNDSKQFQKKSTHLERDEEKDLENEELINLTKDLKPILLRDKSNTQETSNQEEIIHPEVEISPDIKATEKIQKRSRREAKDMNHLLNQEIFLLGENSPHLRTIRRTKNSDNKQEKISTIDQDESVDKEEVLVEDGSGTYVADNVENASTIPEDTPLEKVKRKIEKNLQGLLKSTEKMAVSPRPETREEIMNASTEKMFNNRDTRESKSYPKKNSQNNSANRRNSENPENIDNSSKNSASPSPKKVRNVFGVVGRALEENNLRPNNQRSVLRIPRVNSLPVSTNLDLFNLRATETNARLRKSLKDFIDYFKQLRPLIVKRESPFEKISPIERIFKAPQKELNLHNDFLKNLGESVEKLKVLRNADAFKISFGENKLKEFLEKGEEQLNNLRISLRQKRDDLLNKYETKSLELLEKASGGSSKYDIKDVKKVIDDLTAAVDIDLKKRFSDFVGSIQETQETPVKREIKLPKISDFLKIPRLQEASEDELEEELEDELPNGETEILDTLKELFLNHLRNYPFILFKSNPVSMFYDPSEIYPSAMEQGINYLDEECDENGDENIANDELSSEEDESWNYKDNHYKRIVRSPQYDSEMLSESKIDENLIKGEADEKQARKKRDVDTEENADLPKKNGSSRNLKKITQNANVNEDDTVSFDEGDESFDEGQFPEEDFAENNPNSQMKISSKDVSEKLSKHQNFPPNYIASLSSLRQIPVIPRSRISNYWSYPSYDVPFTNDYLLTPYEEYSRLHRSPSSGVFLNKYNNRFEFKNQELNPKFSSFPSYYESYALEPSLSRQRRQVDNNVIKTTDKNIVNLSVKLNQESGDEKISAGDKQEDQNVNDLESSRLKEESLKNHLNWNKKKRVAEIVNNSELEDSRIEIEGSAESDNLNANEETAVTDNTQNNLESLMTIDKIYDKFVPLTEHRVHSRKMAPEIEKNDSTFLQDMTKTIENIFSYFTNATNVA